MTTPIVSRPFTGRGRRKQTHWTVRAGDVVAKWCITVGGIGTILAVSTVCLFLFSVVAPLFLPARIDHASTHQISKTGSSNLALGLDAFGTTAWWVDREGSLSVVRVDTGDFVIRRPLLDGVKPTAAAMTLGQPEIALGASDGTVRLGTVEFKIRFRTAKEFPPEQVKRIDQGQVVTVGDGIIQRTPQGQFREQLLETNWKVPVKLADSPIALLDHLSLGGGEGIGARDILVALVTQDGEAKFCKLLEQTNDLTGQATYEQKSFGLSTTRETPGKLVRILIAGHGDNIYLLWEDGLLRRYDVRDPARIALVEEVELLANAAARVTACCFVLGRETVLCGDSTGGLRAWFGVRQRTDSGAEVQRLTMVHDLTTSSVPVSTLRPSERSRTLVAGYQDGTVRVFNVTTERLMLSHQLDPTSPIVDVACAPKEDALLAITKNQFWFAGFEPRHPEATLASLFRPVWYEGYDRPLHTWQSSSSTSSPEPKFGLLPLIHGTLKATFYAMLFATPLALLAAIYTSEFLHPRMRTIVKPTIEMMASLPSVVLGFLAALVFAVVVEAYLPQIISVLFCVPFAFLLAAHLWQMLPYSLTVRLHTWRLLFFPIPLVGGLWFGFKLGPRLESTLFAGNMMRWLDGQIGNGVGAWLLLWIPLCALGTTLLVSSVVYPWLRQFAGQWTRHQFAVMNVAKFVMATSLTLLAAFGISYCLNRLGWDPRGSYLATYVQRNAFVVGIVMGFAVIPIVFTIADDALNTVPQHLRSASLACGATPWQTAFRVVVPTAMSGLFSAVMIGLGRAVGETMIVLMAGGNTPVMDWNLFNGFRTLAANIAVELPEAVRDSTHYRTLFLSALTLFLMTFVLNTVAEMVRIRFRKRAIQL